MTFKNSNSENGFSTLEMLIALAVLIVGISAAVLVFFGSQSAAVDSQTSSEALAKAGELMENAYRVVGQDFNLLNPVGPAFDGIYLKTLDVQNVDYYTKKVVSNIAWVGEPNRNQNLKLTTLVTDWQSAASGNTCSSILSGDWSHPQIKNVVNDFSQLAGDGLGLYPITDEDAREGKLYVTVNNIAANTKETFFIFDISNPATPALINKIDNNPGVSAGFNAVMASGNYAYAASAHGASFTTCNNPSGANLSCGQLQVIDVGVNPPQVKYTFKVPGVTGAAGQAIGNSIFYKSGFIYLGLAKTGSGGEFNIIDVHNPLAPFLVGSYPMGTGINAIYVKGQYAYLATPAAQELTVLDISNPASPTLAGGFDAPDNQGNGKSLYLVGSKLYLGRTVTAAHSEFYIVDNSNPASIPAAPLGSKEISSSVNALLVRDYLAFLVTNNQFQVWRIDNPANITQWSNPFLTLPSGGGTKPSLDCEGNFLYAASNDVANKGYLSVIAP